MTPEKFVKEYGDVVVAVEKLRIFLGEEEAEKVLQKLLDRPYYGEPKP